MNREREHCDLLKNQRRPRDHDIHERQQQTDHNLVDDGDKGFGKARIAGMFSLEIPSIHGWRHRP